MNKQKIRQKITKSYLSPKHVGSLQTSHYFIFETTKFKMNQNQSKKYIGAKSINNVKLSLIKILKNL